jgi:hypothetical protein
MRMRCRLKGVQGSNVKNKKRKGSALDTVALYEASGGRAFKIHFRGKLGFCSRKIKLLL